MKRKSRHPNFDQMLELLRAHGFDVAPYPGVPGGVLVSKHGVGAVLAPPQRGVKMRRARRLFSAVHPGIW